LELCGYNGYCERFRDLAARQPTLADVERADLRRERWRAIVADLLVTDSALGLKNKLELGIHDSLPDG
jgi:hypothetical protein